MGAETIPTSRDVEKSSPVGPAQGSDMPQRGRSWKQRLMTMGVESRGILPVPVEERTDTQYSKIFFIWFTMNVNILSFSAGTIGPVVFGLGLRDSSLTILFFNILCCIPPSYFTTWGPKLGLRQMIASRYSFGYYGVILPCILNLIGMCGFCILNSILGGQTLSSVADGKLTWSLGIVIIALISLAVSFCGYKVLNWYERVAWIPVLITFLVAVGVGSKNFTTTSVPPAGPASAPAVLSFGSVLAGFLVTFSPLSSDFTSYFHPNASSWRIFTYSYLGFLLPVTSLQCLGAAASIAAAHVPDWDAGYAGGNVGGLLAAILSPTGHFGKFLTVLLSLSVAGNIAATFYSITLNMQIVLPVLVIVPRYVFSILATAVVVPIAIVGAHSFYAALTNFLSLIGYWASSYVAIILTEHLVFRLPIPRGSAAESLSSDGGMKAPYDIRDWNSPSRLPTGIAALAALIGSFGLVVPCMEQVWYTGPIGHRTGDIGFEVAFALGGILYLPFRMFEIRWRQK